ncbi:MAG: tRNA lysidine(34) synthetase TilS [Betaproteobacteria bacterium]
MPAEQGAPEQHEPAAAPAFLQPSPATSALAAFAQRHRQLPRPWALAYSGGADSTALLHAACALWPGQIVALHVHHGLQAAADDFARQCEQVCASLSIPLQLLRVQARPEPGQSPEDAARRARYRALAEAAQVQGCGLVLLGQHADDQAETVMLALGRGAGLPGLAAMPERFERHGMQFGRPLLELPGAALRQWLIGHGLSFIDDPTNKDLRYSRNLLRARLMPALAEVLPHYRQTLARSARHAAQAQQLLDEVAAQDLAQVGCPPRLQSLQGLSNARQANVLRHWLAATHGARPSAAQLDELLAQVAACTTRGHRIELKVASGRVLRQGPELIYLED